MSDDNAVMWDFLAQEVIPVLFDSMGGVVLGNAKILLDEYQIKNDDRKNFYRKIKIFLKAKRENDKEERDKKQNS